MTHWNRISKLHEAGLIERRPERNPLKAEKSPRPDFNGFVFKPPEPTIIEKSKWNYSQSDWGLMAQFASQKPIYEQIYERERRQKETEKEVTLIKEVNTRKIEDEIKKRKEKYMESRLAVEMEEKRMATLDDMMEHPDHYNKHSSAHSHQHKKTYMDPELLRLEEDPIPDGNKLSFGRNHTQRAKNSVTNSKSKIGNIRDIQEFNETFQAIDATLPPSQSKRPKSSGLYRTTTSSAGGNSLGGRNKSASSLSLIQQVQSDPSLQLLQSATKKQLQQYEKQILKSHPSLTTFAVTSIKDLQEKNPEVLQEYRLERAKQFVNKQGTAALEPPSTRKDVGTMAFRPAGIAVIAGNTSPGHGMQETKSSLGHSSSSGGKTGAVPNMIPMEYLHAELSKTQDAYDRQRLLIQLNGPSTKRYQTEKVKKPPPPKLY